jgi:hypothetical protein
MNNHNKAVLVGAWNRPEYLYVCLSALAKCADLASWDLRIDVDGQGNHGFDYCKGVCPGLLWTMRQINLGPTWHVIEALRLAFKLGYERVLYIDDDIIIKPDTLTYLDSVLEDEYAEIYSLLKYNCYEGRLGNHLASGYGNMYTRAFFSRIDPWLARHGWVGEMKLMNPENRLTEDPEGYDHAFFAFCVKYHILNRYAPKYYALHFGVSGVHFTRDSSELEARMFSGDRETWLSNIRGMVKAGIKHEGFLPQGYTDE